MDTNLIQNYNTRNTKGCNFIKNQNRVIGLWLFTSVHRLIVLYMYTNFHEEILNGFEIWSGHEAYVKLL